MWGGFSAMIGPERNDRCGQRLWRCIVRTRGFLSIVGCIVLLLGCGGASTPEPAEEEVEIAEAVENAADVRNDLVYVCNCGEECDCGSLAVSPGSCSCGSELAQAHLVKVEENEGLLCTCGGDCVCTIDAADETKCSCGNDLKRVSFEGTGVYYCNCGGSCTCNFVSSSEGKCTCGMDLITST